MTIPATRSIPSEKIWWVGLLTATFANCAGQIAWFWRFRAHNITSDGVAYIGLARHLVDGNLKASLHGYWSPLVSWLIATGAVWSRNFTQIGRLVTIGSFLLCLPLLYVLTLRLWHSRPAAALAVFWFSAARGVISVAVGMILADFVLTSCVLAYFILLLGALRKDNSPAWLPVGAAHAIAFLAKAIALPWLFISSAIALLTVRPTRRLIMSAVMVFLIPGIVWLTWGAALRTKYGVFTSGYQLRANLMIDWNRRLNHTARGDDLAFSVNPSLYDNYMVGEAWATIRNFSLARSGLPSMIVDTEIRNLPMAVKEISILLTPAGVLGFLCMLYLLIRERERYRAEMTFACITVASAMALIGAYCMLVFDGRYVIPIAAVFIAFACPLFLPAELVPDAPRLAPRLQKAGLALLVAGLLFFAVYWASAFRTVDRDFEVSCYEAANVLRSGAPSGTLVSIGNGPYPEHGIGFEVGLYVGYLSGWRLIGGNAGLPNVADAEPLAEKVLGAKANAAIVWGTAANPAYQRIVNRIKMAPELSGAHAFSDPYKGEVGTVFLFAVGVSHRGVHGGNLVATVN